MDSTKLAGSGAVTAKADPKRRAKTVGKRKKPNDAAAAGAGPQATPLSRIDGLSKAGSKSDSGIKLETNCGDDSGINMGDTWQRNGHSADFIRQDGLPSSSVPGGPGSVPPPCTTQDNFAALSGPSSPRKGGFPTSGTPGLTGNGPNSLPAPAGHQGGMVPGPMRHGPPGGMPMNGMHPMGDGSGGPVGNTMGSFMPQQSQVFVFTTSLANQAAEAVQRGLFPTILDYHLSQPETRQFLQNMNAGGPAHPTHAYLRPNYDLPDGGPAGLVDPAMGPGPPGGDVAGRDMGGGSALANVELWVQQQNASLQEGPFSPSFGPSSQPMPQGHRPRPNGDGNPVGQSQRCCPGPHHPGSVGEFGPGPGVDPMYGPPSQPPPPGYVHDHPHLMRSIGTSGRVPDENLTPEQLQRREEQLAHLQKIKQMLFPEKMPPGPPGMYSGRPGHMDDMRPMPPHHHMMNQPQRFLHGPQGMMGPPPGMMDQPMPPDGMMMMGGMGPQFAEPGLPPDWELMTPEQREWFRLQQDYYMEQRQKRQMLQHPMGGGPPPPGYFGDGPRPGRTSGPMSPVSPSFNGASPHDAQGFFFQGQPGMNFPPGRPNFGPNGPGGPPNFNQEFVGHPDGPFPPYGNPMMMQDPGQFPGARFPPGCGKPKRKRNSLPTGMPGASDRPGDDIFRHLQPAPSPQQFCSLNLFDGQELTITKQLNLAYQEPATSSPNSSQQPPSSTPPASVSAPPSRKKKKTTAADVRVKPEPAPETSHNIPSSPRAVRSASETTAGGGGGGGGDPTSDRPAPSPSLQSMSLSTASSGPITSATLASLQRGVDTLADRIQADMLRGGPFGAVQMPEPDECGDNDDRRSNVGGSMSDLPPPSAPSSRQSKSAMDLPSGMPASNSVEPGSVASPASVCGSIKPEPGSSLMSPQPGPPVMEQVGVGAAGARFGVVPSGNPSVQSPGGGMVGNASVQIEPHAPNTIQYLPTRPSTSNDIMEPSGGQGNMPPDANDMYRQMGPGPGPGPGGPYCPNGGSMIMPPGYEGQVPPGYNGSPMVRYDGGPPPGYGGPMSPSAMPRGCVPGPYPGDMMFPDGPGGGPMLFPDGQMMHPGPVPFNGNRPMLYRGPNAGPISQGGPAYRPGGPQPPPGVMMHPEFRDGIPERQVMGMRPNAGNQMMMGSNRPPPAQDPPTMPPNPAPARGRTESRSKKKESKRRTEAAAARQNTPSVCEDQAAAAAGIVGRDQRSAPLPFNNPGQGHGPGPMGPFQGGVEPPGGMMGVDQMHPGGPMMMAGNGSPSMRHLPGGPDVPMMGPDEFDVMRHPMQPGDARMMVQRGMKPEMMMMGGPGGKPGMRMDEMMQGGHPGMMQVGPREMDMRPGSNMMGMNDMRSGGSVMVGPGGEMRPGSGMMMQPGDVRPGSGMMAPGSEMRPGSGMMGMPDMNVMGGPSGLCDTRPGSGLIAMSPREDGGMADGSRSRAGNGKNAMHPGAGISRPDSVGKRQDMEMLAAAGEGGMRLGGPGGMMVEPGMRPGSKMGPGGMPEGDMNPGSAAGMEMMDGSMRPGSAMMMGGMGPCDGRMRQGSDMVIGPDGTMRPGSALMMGMGQGDGGNMRSRPEMMMGGMDMMDMGMRPGSDMMMSMGPGEPGMRQLGGPMMMQMNSGDHGMRPGQEMMMGMPPEARLRPGSAAMMMGMGPDGGMMGPGDGGMMMVGSGGDGMTMMGMPGEFDPRSCPPEMLGPHRMGSMGSRMMGPNEMGMRYDGGPPMMPVRMSRPRTDMEFRMMGGAIEPPMRAGPYPQGMRNGGICPPDRQMMMMMGSGPPNAVGSMPPGDFGPGPGMGGPPMGGMGPVEGSPFQQFQQQLYAPKGHHPQQGPPSPMSMMGGPGPGFSGYDPIQNGPQVRFPGAGL